MGRSGRLTRDRLLPRCGLILVVVLLMRCGSYRKWFARRVNWWLIGSRAAGDENYFLDDRAAAPCADVVDCGRSVGE